MSTNIGKTTRFIVFFALLIFCTFIGCFSANRLVKFIDDRKTVERAANRSFLRYRVSTFREASIERELKMAKFGLFKLMDGTMVAEEDEFLQSMLENSLSACRSNRTFFNSPDEAVYDERRRMFFRGCWKYYKMYGMVFDETRYRDVKWEDQLKKFAEHGIIDDDYVRMQKW